MNEDILKGKWNEIKGEIRSRCFSSAMDLNRMKLVKD